MDAYTFIKSANLEYDIQNFSVVVNMVDNEKSAQQIFNKFQNAVIKFFDANLTFAGGFRSKKVQNAILKKAPIVLDKEAELEKLAFQRGSKKISLRLEKINIMVYDFSQKIDFTTLEKK